MNVTVGSFLGVYKGPDFSVIWYLAVAVGWAISWPSP